MDIQDLMNNYIQNVVKFHSDTITKYHFPSRLSISELTRKEICCHFFPFQAIPKIFFVLDSEPKLPDLEFPVIKYMTVLKPLNDAEYKNFVEHLRKLDSCFLVLMESYNEAGINLLERFQPEETYYCQQKLLCFLDKLHVEQPKIPSNVLIRNFIPGRDESRYAAFYNQVLGFLGSRIDRSFVDAIVAGPSFNPEGYFIAENKNRIVGFLSIEKEPWCANGSGFGYIYQIGIAESCRGSGLAEVLLGKARDFAIEQGLNRIGVGVRKSNATAIRFFQRHGFNVTYEVSGYILDINKLK